MARTNTSTGGSGGSQNLTSVLTQGAQNGGISIKGDDIVLLKSGKSLLVYDNGDVLIGVDGAGNPFLAGYKAIDHSIVNVIGFDENGNIIIAPSDLSTRYAQIGQGSIYFGDTDADEGVAIVAGVDNPYTRFTTSIVEPRNQMAAYGITTDFTGGFGGVQCLVFNSGTGNGNVLLPSENKCTLGTIFTVKDGLQIAGKGSIIRVTGPSGSTIIGSGVSADAIVLRTPGVSARLKFVDDTPGANVWIVEGQAGATFSKTITPTGTTGDQTINTSSGSVNFAALAATLTVTNSLVDANSVIVATVNDADAFMQSVTITRSAGSFTLNADNAPASETRVDFIIVN